jgi:sulfotransferase family protein
VARLAYRWADGYIKHGGCARFLEYGIGTWEENLRSWLESGLSAPRLLVRYEDLVADPVAGLTRVARFLGSKKLTPISPLRSSDHHDPECEKSRNEKFPDATKNAYPGVPGPQDLGQVLAT